MKMLLQNASYTEILSLITNPGGRLHVKLSSLVPPAEVTVLEGKGPILIICTQIKPPFRGAVGTTS